MACLPPVMVRIAVLCTVSFIFSDAIEVKWCVHDDSIDCKLLFTQTNAIKCVQAPNIFRCMEMVKAGTADVLYVDDKELYPAGKIGLKPLLQIVHSNSADYRYKAVAVVKVSGKVKKLSDLKNAKSCHTGAGKTTGWTTPVSNLIQMKIISPLKDCYSSAENVGNFFTESCVPGAMTVRFNPLKRNQPRLCGLCKDKKDVCSTKDEYAGYDGAKLCLESTDADIAFVKHETMLNASKTKYKLLCPNDKLMDLDKYEDCNWAIRPSDTIVVSPKTSNPSPIADLIIKYFSNLSSIFKWEKVDSLKKTNKDYSAVLGKGFKNTFEYYHNCKNSLRWCVVSDPELKHCTDLKLAFMAKRATNKLECVKAKDLYVCIDMINQNKADFVNLEGPELNIAMNECKLKPVIAESVGGEAATTFTLAVVKANATFTLKELKDKKSCFGGIGSTAGWKSPISYLIKNKMLPTGTSIPDIPEEVGKFFGDSCAPGALDSKYNAKSLCNLCPEDSKCVASKVNKYYGDLGAFRCLVETGADVAFVKHTFKDDITNRTESWESNVKLDDYKLLCQDGKLHPISDYKKCSITQVPAPAIAIRKSDTDLGDLLFQVFNNFDLGKSESQKLLFSCTYENQCLFKATTTGLVHIEKPNSYFTDGYRDLLKVFGDKKMVCSGSSHSTISVILLLFTIVNYFA